MSALAPNLAAIAVGGACGALARYGVGQLTALWFGRGFPWGTLSVNLVGSICIGACFLLIVQNEDVRREWESVATVGFLGAFTTFSTFSLETLLMLEEGRLLAAGSYAILSLTLCIAGCALGMRLARFAL